MGFYNDIKGFIKAVLTLKLSYIICHKSSQLKFQKEVKWKVLSYKYIIWIDIRVTLILANLTNLCYVRKCAKKEV